MTHIDLSPQNAILKTDPILINLSKILKNSDKL